ncbi:MAG: Kelch repeat-containing protein [Candidatus Odinarchaeota archaeon]
MKTRINARISLLITLVLVTCSLGCTEKTAGVSTNDSGSNQVPVSRSGHAMVYDSIDQVILLFGGHSGDDFLDDTWLYNCTDDTWSEMNPANKPGARWTHGMVYDSHNQKIILFGGYNGSGYLGDTWIYDFTGDFWTEMKPVNKPSVRHTHTMVYDPDSQKVFLFGGNSRGERKGDTWAYDYQSDQWTEIFPVTNPPTKSIHTMSYDSDSKKTIIFGGYGPYDAITDDTWAYDFSSNSWTELDPANKPGARYGHSMSYDPDNKKTILFGGRKIGGSGTGGYLNDTWVYDYSNNNWTELDSVNKPDSRYLHSMVHDPDSQKMILFGGLGSDEEPLKGTWLYDCSVSTSTWKVFVFNSTEAVSGIYWLQALLAIVTSVYITKKRKKE